MCKIIISRVTQSAVKYLVSRIILISNKKFVINTNHCTVQVKHITSKDDQRTVMKMENEAQETNNSTENITNNEDDYVVICIGAFGLWQAGVCIVASLSRFVTMWNMLSVLFLIPSTNFTCMQFEENSTVTIENASCYENCLQYGFDNDVFDETLVSEFGLICEKSWMASLTQTILMFGLIVGVYLFGWISDRFGRRKAMLSSAHINAILMLAIPFSPNYWVFVILRFLIGVASGGTLSVGVVYILEIVGPQYREIAGALAVLPDGIAQASLSAFAYFAPNWRIYLLEYAGLSLLLVALMSLLPETPRWLVTNGKVNNAIEVLTKAAKFNKRDIFMIEEYVKVASEDIKPHISNPTYYDLFRSKNIVFKTLASLVTWTLLGVCFFGINQYIAFVGTDLLITVLLLGLIQVPICPLAIVLNKAFGRKIATITTLLTTGMTMIALVFLPQEHWTYTALGVIGFAASSLTFPIIYVYTCELFPTSSRNMAYGLCFSGAKIGGVIAPFIAIMTPYWVPSLFFAVMAFIASVFCLFLPETKGLLLKDRI